MPKILRVIIAGLSALFLTACFELAAQSKYINVDKGSVDNMIVLGPATTSEGDRVLYTIVSQPTHGVIDESNLPEVTYTPDADYIGKDLFTFKLSDGEDESNVATITITVAGTELVNQAPVARIVPEDEVVVTVGEVVSLSGATSSDDDGTVVAYEWLEDDAVLHRGSLYDANLSVGSHTIVLKVTDDKNATAEDSIEIVVNPLSAS